MRKKTKILISLLAAVLLVLAGLLYYRFVYLPTLGQFGVITNPVGAQVFVNEELVGETPVEFQKKEGVYSLRIEKEGYERYEQEITVVAEGFDVAGVLLVKEGEQQE